MLGKTFRQDCDPPPDELPYLFLTLVCEAVQLRSRIKARVAGLLEKHIAFVHSLNFRPAVEFLSPLCGTSKSSNPGADRSGLFFDSRRPNPSAKSAALVRRKTVAEKQTRDDSFHESESDIYDLYNACNGIVREDGLLDIRELNDFTPEEAVALNVARLKEIWTHTATGCSRCAQIVKILNSIRGTLKADIKDPSNDQIILLDENVSDLIS